MSLTLYMHPLASYCHKALIALYENDTSFTKEQIDLGNPADRARLEKFSRLIKFPVLHDVDRGRTLAESSIIIEYLDLHYPGRTTFLPKDADLRLEARQWDRFFDMHVHQHMQKIVGDTLLPPQQRDPTGVEQARVALRLAYSIIDAQLAGCAWAMGDAFSMADCAAAPALFYSHVVEPIGQGVRHALAYRERLMKRPSYARVLEEARPFFHYFPAGKLEA